MQGPHGSQDQALGSGQAEGKGAVSSAHACQDQALAELLARLPTVGTLQPCPSPALPAHGHWHLWDAGSASRDSTGSPCGEAAAVPTCTTPPLYNHREPAQTCALLHGTGMGPSSASLQPHQGFRPSGRSWGCFPLPGALPPPVTPTAPTGWRPARARAQPAAEGSGCVPQGRGSVSGWRPRAGMLGWVRRVPGRFVAPGTLP